MTSVIFKTCNICKKELSISNFYYNGNYKGRRKYKPCCKYCENRKKRVDAYERLVKVLGKLPQCSKCGYDSNLAALDFHHLENHTKEFNISDLSTKICLYTLRKELEKCIILCSNCHRELHNPENFKENIIKSIGSIDAMACASSD